MSRVKYVSHRSSPILQSDGFSQLEKLLQKNYFLHQSAKDGYRSYLQAYASHSLKKIFDVNALDLVKVGRAFGFSVPPRVNVTVGGGKSGNKSSHKRRRNDDDDDDEENDWVDEDEGGEGEDRSQHARRQGKSRRVETLGSKKVKKEFYKRAKEQRNGNWSR